MQCERKMFVILLLFCYFNICTLYAWTNNKFLPLHTMHAFASECVSVCCCTICKFIKFSIVIIYCIQLNETQSQEIKSQQVKKQLWFSFYNNHYYDISFITWIRFSIFFLIDDIATMKRVRGYGSKIGVFIEPSLFAWVCVWDVN